MTPSHFTLSDLEGQNQGHFRRLISCKGDLVHMLLLNIIRKAYMGSLLMQLHVTLVTFKGLCQGHSGCKSLYLVKELR